MKNRETTLQKRTFFGGVMLLIPATVLAKLIGLFYKIPLMSLVGVEGMAYFLSAYHVYTLLFVVAAAGLPTALSLEISRAVARGERKAVRRIPIFAFCLFLLPGSVGTALLLLFPHEIAARMAMPEAALSLVAVAPALLLSIFCGCLRGYFQGFGNMLPTALSEVGEATGKLAFGLLFALFALKKGLSDVETAAYAMAGITAGVALSALLLSVLLLFFHPDIPAPLTPPAPPSARALLRKLSATALPISVSAAFSGVVALLDTFLISKRLQQTGFAPQAVHILYSSYGNLAVPLFHLVPALLAPVSLSLVPLLAGDFAGKRYDDAAVSWQSALRLTLLVAIPASMGLAYFAEPCLSLLYRGEGTAVVLAAPLLSLLALSVLPAALSALCGGALQAVGHPLLPLFSMMGGCGVKLLLEWWLLSLPTVHIFAAPISTFAYHLTVLVPEVWVLSRYVPFSVLPPRDLWRPTLASGAAMAFAVSVYQGAEHLFSPPFPVLCALFAACGCYLAAAPLFRAVEAEDFAEIPFGDRLLRFLQKIHLLREKEEHDNDKRRKNTGTDGKDRIQCG